MAEVEMASFISFINEESPDKNARERKRRVERKTKSPERKIVHSSLDEKRNGGKEITFHQ